MNILKWFQTLCPTIYRWWYEKQITKWYDEEIQRQRLHAECQSAEMQEHFENSRKLQEDEEKLARDILQEQHLEESMERQQQELRCWAEEDKLQQLREDRDCDSCPICRGAGCGSCCDGSEEDVLARH